jgi:glutamate-1-semialdehyde 2,1-aminomutase
MAGLDRLVKTVGVVAQVVGEPSVFDIVFTDRPVVDYRATLTGDSARLKRFNAECLKHGVLKGGSKIYVSTAHDEADVDRTLAVFERALEAAG